MQVSANVLLFQEFALSVIGAGIFALIVALYILVGTHLWGLITGNPEGGLSGYESLRLSVKINLIIWGTIVAFLLLSLFFIKAHKRALKKTEEEWD